MTYQDLLNDSGGGQGSAASKTLATRLPADNPDHHLWNNRGTWWCHFTLHGSDYTTERVRVSLRTREIAEARSRRDLLLQSLAR